MRGWRLLAGLMVGSIAAGLVITPASPAVGQGRSARAAPPVPANSVCREYESLDGGLAAEDHRIVVTFWKSGGQYMTTFSGLPLSYLYAFTAGGREWNLGGLEDNTIKSGGVSVRYFKACAVDPGPAMPPFASRYALVDQQYRDFFGRPATVAEESVWAGSGDSAQQILDWFVNDEVQQRGPLVRLYKAYYLRWPDPGGYAYWIRKLKSGTSLTAVSNSFAAANEFKTKYGPLTNAQFVTLVYKNVLGRDPESGGYNYWLGRLNAGKISRGGLMLQFSESSEFKRKFGLSCDQTGVALRMLRRAPTAEELAAWGSLSATQLAHLLFGSAEYADRITP